jgi:hypothetical protein
MAACRRAVHRVSPEKGTPSMRVAERDEVTPLRLGVLRKRADLRVRRLKEQVK